MPPIIEGKQRATEETLFDAVNDLRKTMNLPVLEKDSILRNYSLLVLKEKSMPQIPIVDKTVYMSCFHIVQDLRKWSPEKYIEKWLESSSMRQVILSPGNRGAACMFSDPKTKKNYVAFFVATAFSQ